MNLTEAITAFDEAKKALINEGWKSPAEVDEVRAEGYDAGHEAGYDSGYDSGYSVGRDYNR